MRTTFRMNPKYRRPSEEVMRKLELSQQEATQVKTRPVRCPVCRYMVSIIPVNQTDIVFVKCQKCKFEGALSPAYFRRMKQYSSKLNCTQRKIVR